MELQDVHGYHYVFPFTVETDFGLSLVDAPDDLLLTLASNFPLRQDLLAQEFDRVFGQ
ncbi:MAG: hypothetical protein H6765_03835 [Candidatus Peribacteria bacterium]|nr:MAG: hypothetical protein H6765_03835 [Candidatus Peribacteria bacterium]